MSIEMDEFMIKLREILIDQYVYKRIFRCYSAYMTGDLSKKDFEQLIVSEIVNYCNDEEGFDHYDEYMGLIYTYFKLRS